MPTSKVLEVIDLIVERGRKFQLEVDRLSLLPGEIVCLLGENGSGKSTLLEAIAGIISISEGEIYIKDILQQPFPVPAKRHIGYVPDDDGWIIAELTAREYLLLVAAAWGMPVRKGLPSSAIELANTLSFSQLDRQMSSLSHGNRKKVQLLAATLISPSLLVIDELANGLDPWVAKSAEKIVRGLSTKGTAVLAATHDLAWAERNANRIVLIRGGQVVKEAIVADLIREFGSLEKGILA